MNRFGQLFACALLVPVAVLAACKRSGPSLEGRRDRVAATTDTPVDSPGRGARTAQAPAPLARADAAVRSPGARCPLVFGPQQQPWNGPAVLVATAEAVEVIVHTDGVVMRGVSVAAGPIPARSKPQRLALRGVQPSVSSPPCAAAGSTIFCADAKGNVRRAAGDGSVRVVAEARAGSRLSATTIGAGHVLLAYLVERETSEGVVTTASVMLDDEAPMRLSEPGAGATYVELARRADDVVAMLVDARTSMTPVHARVLSLGAKGLALGPDAVVFVGGSPERHTFGAVAMTEAHQTFFLLPIAKDAAAFGMATIAVANPPRDDAAVVWSAYPNGLDPAPIAATHGASPARVARVRPESEGAGAPRVLELGEVRADGQYVVRETAAVSPILTHVAIVSDRYGGVWLYYTDAYGSWLERRHCA